MYIFCVKNMLCVDLMVMALVFTLNNHIDARIVGAKSISGDASEKCTVCSFSSPDAKIGHNTTRQNLFADRVSRIGFGLKSLVVHIPNYTDGLQMCKKQFHEYSKSL